MDPIKEAMIRAEDRGDDFNLDNSQWYNVAGLQRASTWLRNDAESLARYARVLTAHDDSAEVATAINQAETALTESLLAVKLAKTEYAKLATRHLQVAE